MANRRMFAKSIIGSARFLRMPASARLLYYDLGMQADDEGVVEAFSVMRMTGASDDDLRVLALKRFICILNEDLVSIITDWKDNNYIQKDRFNPSIYHELVVTFQNGGMDSKCIHDGHGTDTQDRLGKDRLGKDRLGEDIGVSGKPKQPARHKYGSYSNVLLSDEELEKLKAEFPNDLAQRIERLSGYIAQSGKSYKSHLATIRNWARKDGERAKEKAAPALNYQQHTYTEADFGDDFYYDPERDFK